MRYDLVSVRVSAMRARIHAAVAGWYAARAAKHMRKQARLLEVRS